MAKTKKTSKTTKVVKSPRKAAQPAPASPRARTRTKRQLALALVSPPASPASLPASPTAFSLSPARIARFMSAPSPSPLTSPLLVPSQLQQSSLAPLALASSEPPTPPVSPLSYSSEPMSPQTSLVPATPHAVYITDTSPTPSLSSLLPPMSPASAVHEKEDDLPPTQPSLALLENTQAVMEHVSPSTELIHGEPERTKFKSVIQLNGFQYTKAGTSAKKVTYRCSFYRRKEKCKGKVDFTVEHMAFTNFRAHVCRQGIAIPNVRSVVDEMKDAVDDLVLQNLAMPAEQIWERVRDMYYSATDVAVHGLTRDQVRQRVYRTRREYFGGSMHGLVEVPPLSLVQGSTMSFFQFHRVYPHKGSSGTKLERLIGWGHPVIIDKLKYKGVTLFVDGTFRSKESDMYWNVIDHVIQATDQKLDPSAVICDFESGLIKAVLTLFPDARVSECFFHFKQALGRQMKKLRIPKAEKKIAMASGVVDVLAVVDKNKVAVQGTCYVRKLIRERCEAEGLVYSYNKWENFWAYFNRQWVRRYDPDLWNVDGISKQVVARTNNPLERFNRELNNTFGPHPSLPVFVAGIEGLARRHVQVLQDIPSNRAKSPHRREKYTLPKKVALPS